MESPDLRTLTELLDLEGFEVVEAALDRPAKLRRLTLVPVGVTGCCPHCHATTGERHACHDREVVDLPLGQCKTLLVVRLFQYRCPGCDRFFTPPHPALARGLHATERFLERLAEYASHGDIASAAHFLGIAEKTAERWYYEHLERRRQEPREGLPTVRSLGIDELSLKKDIGSSAVC